MNSRDRTLLLTDLMIVLLSKMAEIGAVISKARAEGRDVSEAELAAVDAQYAAAKAKGDELMRQRSAGVL